MKKRPRGAPDVEAGEAVAAASWTTLWQVPAIVASTVIILAGIYVAMRRAPDADFDAALSQVEQLIAIGDFELAGTQLNDVIRPAIDEASNQQRARFNGIVGDWIMEAQAAAGHDLVTNAARANEQYSEALRGGATFDAARLERWAHAQIMIGDLDGARSRLAEMEDLANSGMGGPDDHRRRNHVLRELVDKSLRQDDLTYDSLMAILADYRQDSTLSGAEALWAIAREAELRLEAGRTQEAIDHLLIDMRRFEPHLQENPELSLGALSVLLARGYYDLGNHRYARYNVEQALEMVSPGSAIRGEALVLEGKLAIAEDDWQTAFEYFDEVVRNYPGTRSFLPGLLGRAETLSILGEAQRSREDYQRLRDRLRVSGPRRDVTRERVARSLADRHDAAITAGKLHDGLGYVRLSETLYRPAEVPPETLLRIASTTRQLADNVIADARKAMNPRDPDQVGLQEIDPGRRTEASAHYRTSAEYYVRHARSLAGQTADESVWASSLWLGADGYDLAGYHDHAISHFDEYLKGRSELDPRRPEAGFRLAQAYQAQMDYEQAAKHYQQIIDEHPRSHVASRSRVPLARCLVAVGRRVEAEQTLLQVVRGERHIGPEAMDYREALIELGLSYYDGNEYVKAIQELDVARRRYPDDPAIIEIRFGEADSYRRLAEQIADQLNDPVILPAYRREQQALRIDHLHKALELFGLVAEARPRVHGSVLDPHEVQLVRHASLYRADCLYELDRCPEAIALYDEVAGRYPREVSSLTALIQIVNCLVSIGDESAIAAAHRRAQTRLRELPDEAFDAPDALLDRSAWERWLHNIPLAAATAGASVE